MLAGLIPGIREIRAPLAGGYLWLCVLVLLCYEELPTQADHVPALDPLFEIGSELSVVALFAVLSVVAYLVGSLFDEVLRGLAAALPAAVGRLRGSDTPSAALYGPVGTRVSRGGIGAIEAAVAHSIETGERELDQVGLVAGEGGIAPRPTADNVKRELELVRIYLQADDGLEILTAIDRCQSEAEFRIAIAFPLFAIAAVLSIQASWLWLLIVLPAAILMYQGYRRHVGAGDELAVALSLGKAQAPSLNGYAASVEAAIKSVAAERELRQSMSEDPMAAFALGRRLEHRQDVLGALEAYANAADRGVVRAHVAVGRLREQRSERTAAEEAYRAGDALGDSEASLHLAKLLSGSRGVEAKEAFERAASRHADEPSAKDVEGSSWSEDDYRSASEAGDVDATFNLGLLLLRKGGKDNVEEAVVMFRRAIDQGEDTGRSWANLGSALHSLGDYRGALEAQRLALAVRESRYGPDHPEVATTLASLGNTLRQLGLLEEALEMHERALENQERAFGADSAEVATTLDGFAQLLRQVGRLQKAREMHERALAIREKTFGADSAEVMSSLNNLGSVLRQLGHLQQAQEMLRRALAIAEARPTADERTVARVLDNLGSVLHQLGDLRGAREMMQQALTIVERVFGGDHPAVAATLGNLGAVLLDLGDADQAREMQDRTLAIEERVYGLDHPEVATTLNNLAMVLRRQEEPLAAKAALERALAIEERAYGLDHPDVASTLGNLANALIDLGDLEGAREALERTLAIAERTYGPDHFDTASALGNLGVVLRRLGRLEEAERMQRRALAGKERAFGPDHPVVANTLMNLGVVLIDLGRLEDARAALTRALAIEARAKDRDGGRSDAIRRLLADLSDRAPAPPDETDADS